MTPPATVKYFDSIKESLSKKLNLILAKQKNKIKKENKQKNKIKKENKQKIIKPLKPGIKIEKIYFQEYSKISIFVPFAYYQWEKQNYAKASILFSLQVSSLALNVGSYWWKNNYLDQYGLVTNNSFYKAQNIQILSIGAFAIFYLYGVIDAVINFKPLIIKRRI